MALYEFFCQSCQYKFEQIIRQGGCDEVKCPKCQGKNATKLISVFAVGGRGDLRETTLHGCHDAHVEGPHDHDGESGGEGSE